MTIGIVVLGTQVSVVNLLGETNGYALALEKTNVFLAGDINGKYDLAPSIASDLEAFSH